MKTWKFGNFANPGLSVGRPLVDEQVVAALERVAEIPNGSEHEFCIAAEAFVHIATAVERLSIVHNLLYDVVARKGVHIDVVFPLRTLFVVGVDSVVGFRKQLRDIRFLFGGKHFGFMVGDAHNFAVAFGQNNLRRFFVVVDFQQPTAGNRCRVGFAVELLVYAHAVFVHSDVFAEEVDAFIVTVEHELGGHVVGSVVKFEILA